MQIGFVSQKDKFAYKTRRLVDECGMRVPSTIHAGRRLEGVRQGFESDIKWLIAIIAALLSAASVLAGSKNSEAAKLDSPASGPFSRQLSADDQARHALDRLTFGPRRGDFEQIENLGLKRWLDLQLEPERIPENTVLPGRLAPFASVRMSIQQTYAHYPPPRMIAAVARGLAPLPDDQELRAIVERLAQRYVQKKQLQSQNSQTVDSNEDVDPELKSKLADVLTRQQIATLHDGKPEEKCALLASIPAGKWLDFVWALRREQRQQLFTLAPVDLRRELMLSVNPQAVVTSDLTESKLLRATYSNRQLEELLVDFWFNHFNVFTNKGADRYLVPSYERDAIRPHVFGKFYDLLLATAQSPAMLFYLDNWESVSTDAERARPMNKQEHKHGLNENYGRELLELHTLGVDGGYTQQDVLAVARCFTGWTIAKPRNGGGFDYNDRVHDQNKKIVLGHVIPAGGGMNDGLAVLNILAHHPSTAHLISLKLAQKFVADDPPPALVNRMTNAFLKTDGDLRQVMRTMLSSPEFWSEGAYRAKFKTPFEMVVSALRATGADVQSGLALASEVQKLGEPLYRKIEPTGYSSANAEWVSSAGLLERMNFGLALTHNRIPGIKVDSAAWQREAQADPMNLARSLLDQDPSIATRQAIEKALGNEDLQKQLTENAKAGPPQIPGLIAGLTIGSPDFQRR